MTKGNIYIRICTILFGLLVAFSSYADQKIRSKDKSLSPYFMILTNEGEVASLPLKSTQVDVDISGVIADVNVKQVYTNTGKTTIEAIYVFPASTRAAVYDMLMQVDDRQIRAKIEEKKKARKMYDQAKREGRTSSLLEQERTNVFKMKVANILPGATVEVDMSYTELLVPTDKVYEFVYPTVVGPRYVNRDERGNKAAEEWTNNPFLEEGVKATSTLDINVGLSTGVPIKEIRCETHKNKLSYLSKSQANLKLNEPEGGNRDFIMQYRLAGHAIESGILTYSEPNGDNYFLAMMQPPQRPLAKEIPAREYVFIIDISGSMNGFPLDISKQIMRKLLGQLDEKDLFNIVLFAGGSETFAEKSMPVNEENIFKALTFIDHQHGWGGTELLQALNTAMSLNGSENYSRSFVILTDGYVSVEKETYDYIRKHLGNANFFSFGIGSSVNRGIIEGMAHVGYGEPFIAVNKAEGSELADKFIKYVSNPVLTNITYDFKGIEAYDVLPKHIPDLFAERPLIITGKYKGKAKGSLSIKGLFGNTAFASELSINKTPSSKEKALRYLWAREKIRLLADYHDLDRNDEAKQEIIGLSKQYNLLTEFTSFIAIDSVVSNKGGEQMSIKQATPLPKGVSNMAVGGGGAPLSSQPGVYPPPPALKVANVMNIIDNDESIDEELEIMDSEADMVEYGEVVVVEEEEEEDEEQIIFVVEVMPEFPGGTDALLKYLAQNVKYPEEARKMKIQGRVYVGFVVDINGDIIDVRIQRGVHSLLDAEALRVIKAMPKWKPGQQRGKPVRVNYTIPINFYLNS
ncbi:TonB family protein [Ancylomarina salipaludis]|uniref:TonB family protein n=1 Tax=Ancylomarina salipaludis TaxID=2501299 RepID=A0A4Q1JJB2_9BACT|nr:TonB family protein [Ancylomarina salipaludis]RXQ90971.1 TonB family protein [Ancylomarina salipaludis]